MARTRRRGFGRRGRARPLDWVCTTTAYDLSLPAILTPCNSGPDSIAISGNPDVINAFENPASLPGGSSTYMPWLEQTCVRIRGTIWAWILPDTSWWNTLTGYAYIKLRVGVLKQLISGGSNRPVPIESFDSLWGSQAGNADFMWEETVDFLAESSWGSLVVDPSLYVRKIPVDIRVQRRLQRDEVVALSWQYIGLDYGGDPEAFPDAAVNFQLRALMRTIT